MEINHSRSLRAIGRSMVLQQDGKDCGVACLLSVIQYYRGADTLDRLRRTSGTNINGTTLLGLYEAAQACGFRAQGCQADIPALIAHPSPVILHVQIEGNIQHYVVAYGTIRRQGQQLFVIGDPLKGVIYLDTQELERLWQTKTCLVLEPGPSFVPAAATRQQQREWVKQLISEDVPLLLVAAAAGLLIACLNLVMAIFSQRLIDDILPARDYTRFNMGIALVLLLLLVKEGLNAVRQYLLLQQGRSFNNRITGKFFSGLLQLPKPFFDTRTTGELVARLNDTSRIQKLIAQIGGNVIIDILVVLVSVIFLLNYSWQSGLITLGALPVYFLLIYRHHKAIIRSQQEVMSGYALSESNYINTLQGIAVIKNHNKQPAFSQQNQQVYGHYQDRIFSLGRIQVRLGWLAGVFGNCFLAGILAFTTYRVFAHQLKPGELMAILGICTTLLPAVTNLALLAIPVNEAKVAFDRMFEFVNTAPEIPAESGTTSPITFNSLSVNGLSFRYAGRGPLLKDVSFHVNRGEIIAVMGENGSGKSTLFQIIQRFYPSASGRIMINHAISLYDIPPAQWRGMIGVVPQQVHIFNGTVLQNITFEDAQQKPEEVIRFLQEYGILPLLHALPQSVYTLVGEEGINLSGGQQQLIALARALYHRPGLLIMDEGTAAMDRNTELFVLRLLEQLKSSMGIIFISHRLHVLKSFCNRIYILDKGCIAAHGDHHQLIRSENLYSNYWHDIVNG